MIHARTDYNRIQDPEGKIPEDEPVFLLRAKDKFAPGVVRMWAALVRASGDERLAGRAQAWASRMEIYQNANGKKQPDAPEGTLGDFLFQAKAVINEFAPKEGE